MVSSENNKASTTRKIFETYLRANSILKGKLKSEKKKNRTRTDSLILYLKINLTILVKNKFLGSVG